MEIYVFDGSMEGLLCSIYEWFERRPGKIILKTTNHYQPEAFANEFNIHNDLKKADRVWKGLQKRLDKNWMRIFYCAFLSEDNGIYTSLFEFACYIFSNSARVESNYGNDHVLAVSQMARKVEREKHRMAAFIRFQQTADDIFYCGIEPDFNVLPLIMKHFKDRYADQKWIIYDLKRHYGLFYDLDKVEEISMEISNRKMLDIADSNIISEKEGLYEVLWKDYFKSTNIKARKNTRLHVKHVPKRYWKYLSEKQVDHNI